jgi:enhancing lycopene biosynthesis protein 2
MKLLAAAEIAMLARDHVMLLSREDRRRLIELVRIARGRRRNLSDEERQELEDLVARLEPRSLFGDAADRLSPLPLPRRLTHGPRRRR